MIIALPATSHFSLRTQCKHVHCEGESNFNVARQYWREVWDSAVVEKCPLGTKCLIIVPVLRALQGKAVLLSL